MSGRLLQNQSYPPELHLGTSTVSAVYSGTQQIWPASNYWDCGYGCQYYVSDPSCAQCTPTTLSYLTALYINGDLSPSSSGLNYYVSLSNNYSPTTKNYKLKFTSNRAGSTEVQVGPFTVIGYPYVTTPQVDLFFSGVTSSMTQGNVAGDTITIALSDDNGSTWTAPITPTSVSLNYNP